MACFNDTPQNRVWGKLDPKRPYERAVTHDDGCVGGADLSCPAGFYEYEHHSGSYRFPCTRKGNTCYRSPDSYTTPLIQCCTDGSDATQIECAPGYCPVSAKCADYMRNQCSTRFTDDARCKAWCTNRPGLCDAGAIEYCSRSPGDPFCACLRSPLAAQGPNAVALPSCFDGKCIAVGYKTGPMLSTNCPSVCQQALSCWQDTNGTCQIDGNQFQLNCGGALPNPAPTPPSPKPGPPTPAPPPPKPGPPAPRASLTWVDRLMAFVGLDAAWGGKMAAADWSILAVALVVLIAAALLWGGGAPEAPEPVAAAQAAQSAAGLSEGVA